MRSVSISGPKLCQIKDPTSTEQRQSRVYIFVFFTSACVYCSDHAAAVAADLTRCQKRRINNTCVPREKSSSTRRDKVIIAV